MAHLVVLNERLTQNCAQHVLQKTVALKKLLQVKSQTQQSLTLLNCYLCLLKNALLKWWREKKIREGTATAADAKFLKAFVGWTKKICWQK